MIDEEILNRIWDIHKYNKFDINLLNDILGFYEYLKEHKYQQELKAATKRREERNGSPS